jgi:hypothetical protein
MRAPLRIRYPEGLIKESDLQIKAMTEDQSNDMNSYLQRLVKLIPGEAVTMHLTIMNLIENIDIGSNPSYQYLPLVGLFVTFVVRLCATRVETPTSRWDIEWFNVLISSFSYVLWVYATSADFPLPWKDEIGGVWIGVAIMVWTFLVPYLYKTHATN